MSITANYLFKGKQYIFDLTKPIDLSLELRADKSNPNAWYQPPPQIKPVETGNWVGRVKEGASTNFNTIVFNPHAHGTHTECLGHITAEFYSINSTLKSFVSLAQLITIEPKKEEEDYQITLDQIKAKLSDSIYPSLIIRTLPNTSDKKSRHYSHSNPPYLHRDAVAFLAKQNIKHLLVDLPSIDKEKDQGKLEAHKAFWNVCDVNNLNQDARIEATITELLYVDQQVIDGLYFLNLQVAPIKNDASPSRPVIYPLL